MFSLPAIVANAARALVTILGIVCFLPASRADGPVDLELVLAIDCSWSINAREFQLQMQGVAEALVHPAVLQAIESGRHGAIAISLMQWSERQTQVISIPWTKVHDERSARRLAATIAASPRVAAEGGTSISGAIQAALTQLRRSPHDATRQVIDISADGRNNNGISVVAPRRQAANAGVTINGLTILLEDPTLYYYFERRVIVGPDAFVERTDDYDGYAQAILRKLIREIGGLAITEAPVPLRQLVQAN